MLPEDTKLLGQSQKTLALLSIAGSMNFMFSSVPLDLQIPNGQSGQAKDREWAEWHCFTAEEPQTYKTQSYKGVASKPVHFFPP